jgi:hypothetical protein
MLHVTVPSAGPLTDLLQGQSHGPCRPCGPHGVGPIAAPPAAAADAQPRLVRARQLGLHAACSVQYHPVHPISDRLVFVCLALPFIHECWPHRAVASGTNQTVRRRCCCALRGRATRAEEAMSVNCSCTRRLERPPLLPRWDREPFQAFSRAATFLEIRRPAAWGPGGPGPARLAVDML